jgi:methylglutamate dehydrogenase subunit D
MFYQQTPLSLLVTPTTLPPVTDGIVITESRDFGLASVIVRKGKTKALAERLSETFRIDLPARSRCTAVGDLTLTATAPGEWLAMHAKGANAFAASLAETVGDLAAVSDQTDAYVLLRLSGSGARDVLGKLVPVDLHPRIYEVYDFAATVAAHIGVMLWRLRNYNNGTPVFQIAVSRSLTSSFCQALASVIPHPNVRSEKS